MRLAARPFPIFLLLLVTTFAGAQTATCPAIVVPQPKPGESLLSEQQESDFGDVMAEQLERDFRVIEDSAVQEHLRAVAARVQAQLPPEQMHIQVMLVDLPFVDAFTGPGGRVYISRKMIAFLRSDDELAAVLGHELGHIFTHQITVDVSRLLRSIGVTQVGDAADVRQKYDLLLEATKVKGGRDENEEQDEADWVGIQAVTRAGYDPQALVSFFDRLAETHGKTGNWLSNMFGVTSRDAKRLRAMMGGVRQIPAGCLQPKAADASAFQSWQRQVAAFNGTGRVEKVHGVLHKVSLHPTLTPNLEQLRFSPNGVYLMAQDAAGIAVFQREPLQELFYIEAPGAEIGSFSPDSKRLSWMDQTLHVEWWDVAAHSREAAFEIALPPRRLCLQSVLSPDGKTIICYDDEGKLLLIDAEQGDIRYKKEFGQRGWDMLLVPIFERAASDSDVEFTLPPLVRMAFSSNGRYLLLSRGDQHAALDLVTRQPIPLPPSVSALMNESFTFLDGDRFVGVNGRSPEKSAVLHFPEGSPIITPVPLGHQQVKATTHGNLLRLTPIRDHPLGLFDVSTGKIPLAGDDRALDVFDDLVATEFDTGDVALMKLAPLRTIAQVPSPTHMLGGIAAVAVSEDFRWLAISARTRGGIWDLETGARVVEPRGFVSAGFARDGTLFCIFPKQKDKPRRLSRFGVKERQFVGGADLEDKWARLEGPVLFRFPTQDQKTYRLEAHEPGTDVLLWSRPDPDIEISVDRVSVRLILPYWGASKYAKDQGRTHPVPKVSDPSGLYWVEIVDGVTGGDVGKLWAYAGNGAKPRRLQSDGEFFVLTSTENRVYLYNLRGEVKGKFFGNDAALSAAARLLAVENESGHLALFDMDSAHKLDEYEFEEPVTYMQFDRTGKKLFVLTRGQVVYTLDTSLVNPRK